jgi:hypothetical protein
MWLKTRLFLIALLVGAVFAQTSLASVASVSSAPMQAMQEDCCPNDCPDVPECDAACIAAMQCSVAPIVLGLELSIAESGQHSKIATFLPARVTDNPQPLTDGLRRPPKA